MKDRLQQFWNWGHNCRVLTLTFEQATGILQDTRFFVPRSFLASERRAFNDGFHTAPQWTRDNLRWITIRPILRVPDVEIACTTRTPHTPETLDKMRKSSAAFWDSEKGTALRIKLRNQYIYKPAPRRDQGL